MALHCLLHLMCLIFGQLILFSNGLKGNTSPVIRTSSGDIQGMDSPTHPGVRQFLGIPYAEPPIRKLRFQYPIPKTRMRGVLNATSYGAICPQPQMPISLFGLDGPQSEDCLFLNIFAPERSHTFGKRVPVMVFIHGGGFVLGGAVGMNGAALVDNGGVIVVTINYRLGVLGFLSTGDDTIKGNWGLWDQVMALRWVNQNIARFGGDKRRITIFGESAGAASVEILAMTPRVSGLFQKVIVESGLGLSPSLLQSEPMENAKTFAKLLNCETENADKMVKCVSSSTVDEIITAQSGIVIAFVPSIDSDLIPSKMIDIANGTQRYDFMIGVNKDEGRMLLSITIKVAQSLDKTKTYNFSQSEFETNGLTQDEYELAIRLNTVAMDRTGEFAKVFQESHEAMATDAASRARIAADLVADAYFVWSSVQQARIHAGNVTKTYMYRFDPYSTFPWSEPTSWADGAAHGDELFFVFGGISFAHYLNITISEGDELLSEQMMTYWTNFAKTGNPNLPVPEKSSQPHVPTFWPAYNHEDEAFIIFDRGMGDNSTGNHIFQERIAFWEKHNDPSSGSATNILAHISVLVMTLMSICLH